MDAGYAAASFISTLTSFPKPLLSIYPQHLKMGAILSTCWAEWEATWHNNWLGWWACRAWECQAWSVHLILSFFFIYKACFFREGWVVGCQWTIPSYLQCGAACRAGPWGQWRGQQGKERLTRLKQTNKQLLQNVRFVCWGTNCCWKNYFFFSVAGLSGWDGASHQDLPLCQRPPHLWDLQVSPQCPREESSLE